MKLRFIINELESREATSFIALRHNQHSSALNYTAGQKAFDHHWKIVNDLSHKWAAVTFPWLDKQADTRSNTELVKDWRSAYRGMTEEELRKRTEETTKAFKEQKGPPNPNAKKFGDWR